MLPGGASLPGMSGIRGPAASLVFITADEERIAVTATAQQSPQTDSRESATCDDDFNMDSGGYRFVEIDLSDEFRVRSE